MLQIAVLCAQQAQSKGLRYARAGIVNSGHAKHAGGHSVSVLTPDAPSSYAATAEYAWLIKNKKRVPKPHFLQNRTSLSFPSTKIETYFSIDEYKMQCPICYKPSNYEVQCGSVHTICDSCEVQTRMKSPATREGRILICPICHVKEKIPGKRTAFSYEYELREMYKSHCESGTMCADFTKRKCSYPGGCSRFVCNKCLMCVSHFQ